MKKTGLLLLLLLSCRSYGQSTFRAFLQLSRPEKCWTLTHVFKAKRAYRITLEARRETAGLLQTQLPDTFLHGGTPDAFRHSYWMARLGQSIGETAARKLGKAHERGNYISFKKNKTEDGCLQDATAVEMDLFNNEAGLRIACLYPAAGPSEIKALILEAMLAGKMKILLRDSSGNLCDCKGQKVNTINRSLSDWKLPYCLIPSSRP